MSDRKIEVLTKNVPEILCFISENFNRANLVVALSDSLSRRDRNDSVRRELPVDTLELKN